jgi:P4 family phage/plasmid primase-like protien
MSSIPHGATAPAVLPVNPDGIPDSLKALPRWVLWRYDPVKDTPGEFSKVLYRTTGNKARANDERTWATFDAVIKVYQRGGWAGVGIALGDGIVGVDLDDVRGPDGVLTTFGRNILDGATTYHEVSPSGTGVKAFAFVDVEGGKGTGAEPIEGGQSIEVYKGVDTTEPRPVGFPTWPEKGSDFAQWEKANRSYGRWFAVTGHGNGLEVTADTALVQRAVAALVNARSDKGNRTARTNALRTASEKITSAPNGTRHNALKDGAVTLTATLKAAGIDPSAIAGIITSAGEAQGLPADEAGDVASWAVDTIGADSDLPQLVAPMVTPGTTPPTSKPKLGIADRIAGLKVNAAGEVVTDAASAARALDWAQNAPKHTDLGNATRLCRLFGDTVRYVHTWGQWLTWDGTRWAKDETRIIDRMARMVVRQMYADAADTEDATARAALVKWAIACESSGRLAAMVELAKSEEQIAAHHSAFDTAPWLLNCLNGTLDLKTGQLRPHSQDDYLTKRIDVDYDPNATAPIWDRFLGHITGGDTALIEYLQRAIGYTLTGDTSEQCLFFLHGDGSNGKSTFFKAVIPLLGPYYKKLHASSLLKRSNESAGVPNDIAALAGIRMVVSSELANNQFDEEKIKDLTGCEPISARFMRAEWFEFTPAFKIWLYGNNKPRIRGTDYGIWRRIRLIPFAVKLSEAEKDLKLSEKLADELPGILAWAVRGCLDWQRYGLVVPACVTAATEGYRKEMDTIAAFLGECCVLTPKAESPVGALYDAYTAWCDSSRERALSKNNFSGELEKRGYRTGKRKNGTVIVRVGIGLLDHIRDTGIQGIHPDTKNGMNGELLEHRELMPNIVSGCIPVSLNTVAAHENTTDDLPAGYCVEEDPTGGWLAIAPDVEPVDFPTEAAATSYLSRRAARLAH